MQQTPAYLASLKEKSGLSHTELGERCGLSKVAVWRAVTPGYAIKGTTLDTILREGFQLEPDSREYKKAVALWTRDRLTGSVKESQKSALIQAVAGMSAAEIAHLKKWMKSRKSG